MLGPHCRFCFENSKHEKELLLDSRLTPLMAQILDYFNKSADYNSIALHMVPLYVTPYSPKTEEQFPYMNISTFTGGGEIYNVLTNHSCNSLSPKLQIALSDHNNSLFKSQGVGG